MRVKRGWLYVTIVGLFFVTLLLGVACKKNTVSANGNPGQKKHEDDDKDDKARTSGSMPNCGGTQTNYLVFLKATDEVLEDRTTGVIFLCENDTIEWKVRDAGTTFVLAIEGEHADEIFESKKTLFVTTASSGKQTVHKPTFTGHVRHRVHKYSIEITGLDHQTHAIDPHIIPMGN